MKLKINQSFAAFTVVELVMVALLTVITATAAFRTIDILNHQFKTYENDSKAFLDVTQFKAIFTKDISESTLLERRGDNLILHLSDRKIKYQLTEKGIIRSLLFEESRDDVFKLSNIVLKTYFKNEESYDKWIDRIIVTFQFDNKTYSLPFNKTYSAKELCIIDYASKH